VTGGIQSSDIAVYQFGAFLRNALLSALPSRCQTYTATDESSHRKRPDNDA
jgi:hypothetical protein